MKFDAEALRPMILSMNANVAAMADSLACDSEELRTFIFNTPPLRRAMDEVIARGVDRAVAVLFSGLDDEHYGNQMMAAREFMKSRAGQRRGFNHAPDLELKMPKTGGALTLTWLPPETLKPEPPMIEGEVMKDDDDE